MPNLGQLNPSPFCSAIGKGYNVSHSHFSVKLDSTFNCSYLKNYIENNSTIHSGSLEKSYRNHSS